MNDVIESVGCSEFSPRKWDRLHYLLAVHIRMCQGVISRNLSWTDPRYHFVDLYAGPGLYPADRWPQLAGMVGSPLIALNEAARAWAEVACYFVEKTWAGDLRRSLELSGFPPASWEILPVDCLEAADDLARRFRPMRKLYGLIFADPNGMPSYEAIRRLAAVPACERMDFLINVNATVNLRVLKSPVHPETRRATEHLRAVGKRNIYLWRSHDSDRHHFTLAYCTNGPFPEFPNHGFHKIDSPTGRRIARSVDYTREERQAMGRLDGFLPGLKID